MSGKVGAHSAARNRAGRATPQAAARLDHPATIPLRDHRGRFIVKLRATPEGSCEWLIWSRYHRAWHRKSSTGGACGYTDDIAEAGLFPRRVAAAYNDNRDRPYHFSEKRREVAAAIELHDLKLRQLRALRGPLQ